MAVAAPVLGAQRQELVMGKPEQRLRPGFAILVFAPVVWMAATRGYIADSLLSSKLQKKLVQR